MELSTKIVKFTHNSLPFSQIIKYNTSNNNLDSVMMYNMQYGNTRYMIFQNQALALYIVELYIIWKEQK